MLVPHVALRFECRIYSYGALSTMIRKALGWIHNGQELRRFGSPPQLVGRVQELLATAELRQRMGEAGRERVQRLFTRDGHAQEIHSLYKDLLPLPETI